MPSAYQNKLSPSDPEGGDFGDYATDGDRVDRKKSLVRPDREKIEPGHRQWHYRTHAAQLEGTGGGRVGVMPSTTGNLPQQREKLRRGKSLLAREEDVHESGLALFKRGTTLRRKRPQAAPPPPTVTDKKRTCLDNIGPGPKTPWFIYCFVLTCWIPPFLLSACGIKTPEQQRAWREKMGLMSIILTLMAGVGFITFGFTETVCGTPPNRFHAGQIENASVVIHGYDYDFSNFKHPAVGSFNGQTNPLLTPGWNLGGNDASFLFQITNENCLGIITKANGSSITGSGNDLDWYFPCNVYDPTSTATNLTAYTSNTNCHVSSQARQGLQQMNPLGQVYYNWGDVAGSGRNLAVFESSVLDLDLLQWLSPAQVNYPSLFDDMKNADGTYNGKDLSMFFMRSNQQQLARCLEDTILVGFIDTQSIGCVASEVVLYLSLTFIIGVVAIRFVMAVYFAWFYSWKLGNFPRETYEQRMQRSQEIEDWSNDIYRPAPSEYRPNVGKNGLRFGKASKKTFLPSHSRFTPQENLLKGASPRPTTTYGMIDAPYKRSTTYSSLGKAGKGAPPESPGIGYRQSKSTMSFGENGSGTMSGSGAASPRATYVETPCPFPLHNVIPQPPPDYEPFNFPLAHTICLVTAYSESVEGLRTTLDSLATTDYPNSHKLILVIADGMVKGAGNDMTTPEICLSMMKEFLIQPNEVEPHSYVAIADGHKRHNMAKVYAGFYDYDDNTVEHSKQQRIPMVVVAKCGNPLEVGDAKPGNRGKRDSQIVLMGFLQKVMFDERMTTFEYEFFNSIWRVTGVSPDRYELVLCVDADTKVFPDSLTRMASCMVMDVEIMGLCGETKIANKTDNFVTMMQVFEYYISHHMVKGFEAMFGGVTCLPGCFSMYRIKAPKGDSGYWVPVLANPDIVEHYSENVVDTLHKKNLLLLGEDRYLTTLLLKTFPKRKNMFCPQAVCKTIVPDTFRILLSQRRRWINSTVHNLAELLLVRDLCGTFCFSMQFVVGMELAGTLVLPAAISFTLYLIIISIIPGGTNTTIPLTLLAIVLGLPGVLIVVTSRKVVYLGWMIIYLVSLPIWNGLLPAYSFWHFDDFSWGQTRMVAGDKGGDHGDKEGEFDSTHIVMKKWAEFERERRWKSGVQSRDSTVFERINRYSMASNSDTNHPPSANVDSSTTESASHSATPPVPRIRHDSNTLLTLPAPLSVNKVITSAASASSVGLSRSSEDAPYISEPGSGSHARLIPSPQDNYIDSYTESPTPRIPQFETQVARSGGVLRNPTVSSQYVAETQNPFRSSEPHVAAAFEEAGGYTTEPEEFTPPPPVPGKPGRGVSLADNGPVPGPEGVRRVARPTSRRPTSQTPQNRYSRSSAVYNLPPGAAPPQPGGGYSGAY
ncbi:glycosyltransferase family 2 protein [Serpula lacrymans var. lacrymans S7.3]|uniref:chitin synthase n=2 Tax=Serpula lacrymans var. lacrymans TaxID=341189 RepID=F8QDT9_SERL3|nr:glycosyltransferase family 2 protein [Serpula lacrymans var. lacrymans S7.9]EGN93760.1 glycosyltransferase family 2 protein [Serpula lacrymans var. lacrymans S7.3]EGO19131.1 glycosyltransferase family 2 protein [Serpula lacrymans var. lacrymans S7.9]